jgi:hypothetical protein
MEAKDQIGTGFVQRELTRIAIALREASDPERYAQLYAAQQALSWALEPTGFASPFESIMVDTQATPASCSGEDCPPLS